MPDPQFTLPLRPSARARRANASAGGDVPSWNQKTAPSPVTLYQPTAVRSPTTAVYEMSPTLDPLSLQFAIEMRRQLARRSGEAVAMESRPLPQIGERRTGAGGGARPSLCQGGSVPNSPSLASSERASNTSGKLAGVSFSRSPPLRPSVLRAFFTFWTALASSTRCVSFSAVVSPGQTFHRLDPRRARAFGTLQAR